MSLEKHGVRCDYCGKTVLDIHKTGTEIRHRLREQGWQVAIPFRMTVPRDAQIEPGRRRKTVDWCPACLRLLSRDAAKKLDAHAARRAADQIGGYTIDKKRRMS